MARRVEDAVRVEGLAELRRALKRIDRDLDRDLARYLRSIGYGVRDRGRSNADEFRRTGALSKSIRASVTARRGSVYSNLPQAPVHEYGGTIQPRGVPISIEARGFLTEAVRQSRTEIQGGLEEILDAIARTWDD